MQYYYLNSEKQPQGPYSLHEMQQLYCNGVITHETLAAMAGASKWNPFSELDAEGLMDDCSTWNKAESSCPHYQSGLSADILPLHCSHCGRELHAHSRGLVHAFAYAMKNPFNWKGRATRTEFWGFTISYFIIMHVVHFSGQYFLPETVQIDTADAEVDASFLLQSLYLVVMMLIPGFHGANRYGLSAVHPKR